MPKVTYALTTGAPDTLAEESTGPARPVRAEAHTRRKLLASAASGVAAAVVAAPPAVAVSAGILPLPADPHPAWHAEWERLIAHMDGPAGASFDCISEMPEWARHLELEERICRTPARTAAGALAQLRTLGRYFQPENGRDAAAMANLVGTLEALAARAGA